ncbi:MAG: aldose epimerase family protein [Bryobacteraceae bacterium]
MDLYALKNKTGIEAAVTSYGGRLVTLKTPDRDGKFEDIVLGFDNPEGYLGNNPYFGALVGRYANRIARGEFTLNGTRYELARNNGENALHGGLKGFDKVLWRVKELASPAGSALELKYLSRDGEEGYPGNLSVTVTYTLTPNNELKIDYEAASDKDTVLNLTNHSYFNLAGQAFGSILEHRVMINADQFTPANANLIPTGELRNVEGTPFDFREAGAIGARIDDDDEQLRYGAGYDHNFVLKGRGEGPRLAARATEPRSGRVMEVLTTQPGMQFYTGNHLDGTVRGKGGTVYGPGSGFCLETQHFPDSPNQPNFPSTVLKPGHRYQSTTILRFSVAEL